MSLDSAIWAIAYYVLPGVLFYFLHSKMKMRFLPLSFLAGIASVGGYFLAIRLYGVGFSMALGLCISYIYNDEDANSTKEVQEKEE